MSNISTGFTSLYELSPDSQLVSLDNAFTTNEDISKSQRLQKAKDEKLANLSKLNNNVSLDPNTFTQLEDGRLLSNKNKVWNDLSGEEIQSTLAAGISSYGLTQDAQGNTFLPDGTPYQGSTKRLYMFGTKDKTNDEVKLGIASGHTKDAKERYTPKFLDYGWDSGELGADINDKQMDVLLPSNVATVLEGLVHGRKQALEGRVVRDKFDDYETYDDYGSGGTEYYKNREALLGAKVTPNTERGLELLNNYLQNIYADKSLTNSSIEVDDNFYTLASKGTHRLKNTFKGFGATLAQELLINPIDFVGDQTGLFDLGTEQEKTTNTNNFFGYDDKYYQETIERMRKDWDTISDPNTSIVDKMRAGARAVLDAMTTPEMLGTSLGALAAWMAPGALLGKLGVGAKYASEAKKIDAAVKKGDLTKQAGRAKKAKAFLELDGAKHLLAKQSGFVTSAFGNINNQYEQFVANNGGKELEGSDKAAWFAERFAVQMANQNIEKLVDLNVLKSPGILKSLVPAVKGMTQKEFGKALSVFAKGTAVTISNMGKEGVQEYLQTTMELYNARYGSEVFKDLDSWAKFLSDKRNIDEAAVAGLAGMGGSGQFELAGTVTGITAQGANGAFNSLHRLKNAIPSSPTGVDTKDITDDIPTVAGKKKYGELLTRLRNEGVAGKINVDNVASYLDDLETLNDLKHHIASSPQEQIDIGEKHYEAIVTELENFVKQNYDKKLLKRITRKTVEEAVEDKKAADKKTKEEEQKAKIDAIPEHISSPFKAFASALTDGEEKSTATAFKIVSSKVGKSSYKSLVEGNEEAIGPFIKNVEKVVTGAISDDLETSFNNVHRFVKLNKINEFSDVLVPKTDTADKKDDHNLEDDTKPAGKLLGSSPNSLEDDTVPNSKISTTASNSTTTETDLIDDTVPGKTELVIKEYSDYTRGIDMERILHILFDDGKTYAADFENKLKQFAKINNVSDRRYEQIKTYDSVDEEATTGKRGYLTRINRLKRLVESSDAPKDRIIKEYSNLLRMTGSIENSSSKLKRDIKNAIEKAIRYNKINQPYPKGGEDFEAEYKGYDKDKKTYTKPFYIKLGRNKDRTQWYAHVSEAEKRLAKKEGYIKEILEELHPLSRRIEAIFPGSVGNIGSYQVPETSYESQKGHREKDRKYLGDIFKMLDDLDMPNLITKVILGQKTSEKWKHTGDYSKANRLITNQQEYESDDVVLLNSLGVFAKGKTKKGTTHYLPDILIGNNAVTEKLNESQTALRAAIEANATIVLDSDYNNYNKTQTAREARRAGNAIAEYLKGKGYESIKGSRGHLFVKKTPSNLDKVERLKRRTDAENAIAKEKRQNKSDLLTLYRANTYDIDPDTGSIFKSDTERNESNALYRKLKDFVAKEQFKGDYDKLDRWLERNNKEEIEGHVAEYLNAGEKAVPPSFKDLALESIVTQRILAEIDKDATGEEILKDWQKLIEEGKDSEKAIEKLISKLGVLPKNIARSILGEDRSFAWNKDPVYEETWQDAKTKQVTAFFKRDPLDPEVKAKYLEKNRSGKLEVRGGSYKIFLGSRKVQQDPSKLVKVGKTTVLNSVPLDALPFQLRDLSERFGKDIFEVLKKVTKPELEEQTGEKVDGKYQDGNTHLYNSPSRGIIFNKDGEANPEVMAAMYLAVGEVLLTDMKKLIRGFKKPEDVANMFNLQAYEVSAEARKIATENGAFAKTIANSLGKKVLAHLGISERFASDIGKDEYKSLVADIGNATLLLGEKQGIFKRTEASSDDLAKIFKHGKAMNDSAVTHFIRVTDEEDKSTRYKNYSPSKKVLDYRRQYEEVTKLLPNAQTERRNVVFSAPTSKDIERATSSVHNDITNAEVPAQAKETLGNLMKQEHTYDVDVVESYLNDINNSEFNIKKIKGYIDPKSREWGLLSYSDKELQKETNDNIENEIKELEDLKKTVEKRKDVTPSFWYRYSYILNQRYMLESNTTHPQNVLDHRFLLTPKEHRLNYKIHRGYKGALEFDVVDEKGNYLEDSNQSYAVRLALAQAFGQSVDKMTGEAVIAFSDTLLSMNKKQFDDLKTELKQNGKAERKVKGVEKAVEYEIEHVGQAYHAFKFLDNVLDIAENNKDNELSNHTFESMLTLEFDSLTSGFFNKIQQFPIISDIMNHYARTGILTQEYQNILMANNNFYGEGVAFDPAKGHSTSDLAHFGYDIGYDDSYQNMSRKTIKIVLEGNKQKDFLTQGISDRGVSGQKIFESLKRLFPGGDFLEDGKVGKKITSSLRNLFKYPFMIFNYSGGINTIIGNLSFDTAHDIMSGIAKADLNDSKNKHIKEAVERLLKSMTILNPADKKQVNSIYEFQDIVREFRLNEIKIEKFTVAKSKNETTGKVVNHVANNLEQALETVIQFSFGEAVKSVFEDNFSEYIELQKNINDTFKAAFRIFDHKRVKRLSEILREKDNGVLTVDDHIQVLEELWEDFPWIAGPLSTSKSKIRKDVIAVVDSSVQSPNLLEASRNKPQTILASGQKTDSSKVSPLIKYMKEAISAGTVVPFHAIEGAEMSYMINDLVRQHITGILTIHDATIPPLNKADEVTYTYNKGTIETNRDYSMIDEIESLVKRIEKTANDQYFKAEFAKVHNDGLSVVNSIAEKTSGNKSTFPESVEKILANMKKSITKVKAARKLYFDPDTGLMNGAFVGNMIPTPGGIVKVGSDAGPDKSYKKVYSDLYEVKEFVDTDEKTSHNNDSKHENSSKNDIKNQQC